MKISVNFEVFELCGIGGKEQSNLTITSTSLIREGMFELKTFNLAQNKKQ